MARGKAKAPEGCFWRGPVLWGKIVIKGRTYRESLKTDIAGVARERRATWVKSLQGQAYDGVTASRLFTSVVAEWKKWQPKQVGNKTFERYCQSLISISDYIGANDTLGRSQLAAKD